MTGFVEHLRIEWIDPRGKIWDLTSGEEGVLLDLGQEGLEVSGVEHQWARGGTLWVGAQIQRAEPSLRILVGDGLTGQPYYALADEWWSEANSVFEEGVLRVTRPDGEVREMRCRLRAAPGTSFTYDPGQPFREESDRVEAWLLAGSTAMWQGRRQESAFGIGVVGGRQNASAGTPFFGTRGYGWPLYISQPTLEVDQGSTATFTNRGQGPMWLTWRLVGPMSDPRVGIGESVLAYRGAIPAGEVVEITTEPGRRAVTELGSGQSRFGLVSGAYAPVPVGVDVPLVATAEGMSAGSRIIASGRPQYRRPF